ncbi:MAG: AAA family ATPase [Lachnospiraceae bacterium]|nr:AAA family ATPase [Lachnospiraceae bacterium]
MADNLNELREEVTGEKDKEKKRKIILEYLGVKFSPDKDDKIIEVNGRKIINSDVEINRNGLIKRDGKPLIKVHAGQMQNGIETAECDYVLTLKDDEGKYIYFASLTEYNNNIIYNKGSIAYDDNKLDELKNKLGGIFGVNSKSKEIMEEIQSMIKYGIKQIVLTGAPGTGKTYLAKKIAGDMVENSDTDIKFVQFHPSYDYTDFVEGLKPLEIEGNVTFVKMDGIFKAFCRTVAENNEKNENNEKGIDKLYFFIIDEINRADLSKVFGELMYGLESDKRGKNNRIQLQYDVLPTYNKDGKLEDEDDIFRKNEEGKSGFYIPENIIIIATMNDIDRSVESMDFALRRRFVWKEIKVEDVFESALTAIIKKELEKEYIIDFDQINDISRKIALRVNKMNRTKNDDEFGLNDAFDISQGQFSGLSYDKYAELINRTETDDNDDDRIQKFLEFVFAWRIEPLLREYVRGEEKKKIDEFVEKCKTQLLGKSESNTNESDSKDE